MRDTFLYPNVTISIINLDGEDYLSECLKSIKGLNYPQEKIEIIVVDNGSKDNSIKLIEGSFPNVKIIRNNSNLGFAKANNQAAEVSEGDYIAFLNNDTKVDPDWLTELIRPVYGSSEIICSGSKVLSFDGKSIDFAGGMINFEGKGFQIDYGLSVEKDIHNIARYLPFVNGGAMLVKKEVFIKSGGFDEDFFAYYEDVDLGWRLWVLGYKVVFAPKSIVYHTHHGTSKNFSEDKLRFLKERNALISIFKNYDESNLASILSSTLASIFGRVFIDFKFDYKNYYNFDLNNPKSQELSAKLSADITNLKIDPQPLSSLMAAKDFLDNISKHRIKRDKIQNARQRDDKTIFNYFKGQLKSETPGKFNILKKFILSVGTIEPRKNFNTLIKAFNIFKDNYSSSKDYQLVIAGKTGWKSEETFDEYKKSPYRDEIIFTGEVNDEDLVQLYNQASLFVYPSIFEGFGLPVLEAMSCALPVIAANTSSVPEVYPNEEFLLDPFDEKKMAQKINLVLADNNKRDDLIRFSIENSKKFSWEKSALETLQIYRQLYNC